MRHRPAHADQLHVDVWIDGVNVAADAGSYRYTAPPPWSNALADEQVHNVPRWPGRPQASRRGRFLWLEWAEAKVTDIVRREECDLSLAVLDLGACVLERVVARVGDLHIVADRSTDHGAVVRWNLPAAARTTLLPGMTGSTGPAWHAQFTHSGNALRLDPVVDDPASGWLSPTYGVRIRASSIEYRVREDGTATAVFGPSDDALPNPIALPPSGEHAALERWLTEILDSVG